MKKLLCFITTLLLAISLPMSVLADTELSRVVDSADLISDSEEQALAKKIDKIIDKYACDVVLVTTNDLEGKPINAYADDYFDYNGYGFGPNYDGVLMVVYIGIQNKVWISTCGHGMIAFSDYGIDYILDEVTPILKKKEFNKAFDKFVTLADDFIDEAQDDKPYDYNNKVKGMVDYIAYEAVVIVISLVIAIFVVMVMRSKMNTAIAATTAREYVRDNSLNLREQRDVYMYSNVSKVRMSSNSSSRGGGGGGSSSHTSSSGRSHGGGGRSF